MGSKYPPQIFREYDIRGLAGTELNETFAEDLGRAYGAWAQEHLGRISLKISVGQDCRLTSPAFSSSLIRGLCNSGVDVIDLGVCPTPVTYFSLFHLPVDGAIMVTGSHNPSEYNGFKICIGKDSLHGAGIQTLSKWIEQKHPLAKKPGVVRAQPINENYIQEISKQLGPLKKMKVVLDAGNGTAGPIAPALFQRLGAEVIPLFCNMDGRFPNHHPDPTVQSNLKALVQKIQETGADFGVAFDGDSDRIGVVDEKGRILFGDELMIIFSRSILKKNPGATIISEVKSSNRLYQDIKKHGGVPLMWKTGHSLIKAKLKETRGLLAGEMSGHVFFADRYYGYDDAIYSAARFYEIAAGATGAVSTLLSDLVPVIATPEIRIDCPEQIKFALVEETKSLLSNTKNAVITDIDGVRMDFEKSWGLIRASNTQPVLVLRYEAQNETSMREVRSLMESALQAAAQKMGHTRLDITP